MLSDFDAIQQIATGGDSISSKPKKLRSSYKDQKTVRKDKPAVIEGSEKSRSLSHGSIRSAEGTTSSGSSASHVDARPPPGFVAPLVQPLKVTRKPTSAYLSDKKPR